MDDHGIDAEAPLDGPALVDAVVAAGGPALAPVGRLEGGEVGAWLVRWPDGHEAVLTRWVPIHGADPGSFPRTVELVERTAEVGIPVPRYEATVPLPDGSVAVVQERVEGVVPARPSVTLVDQLVAWTDRRRDLLGGTSLARSPMPLHLHADVPGFAPHATLRTGPTEARRVLEAIEAEVGDDDLAGSDVVHFDHHVGNVLTDPVDAGRITGIVDWGGVRPGRVELDLAMLAFDLTWRSPGEVQQRVERHLVQVSEPDVLAKVWAHASLRLLDFAVRHHPRDVDHWVGVARRHLPS